MRNPVEIAAEWSRQLRMLLFRRRFDRDLREELRLHLELRERERSSGAVLPAFGNELLLRERSRDMWGWIWLETFAQDVRHGLRLLIRTPLVTALALLSLTLGIGANTALFSLTDAMVLRALPVSHPEQLMQFTMQAPRAAAKPNEVFTNPLWEEIRDRQEVFAGVFAWDNTSFDLQTGGEQRLARGLYVSGSFFDVLGVRPVAGRLLSPSDDRRGCSGVAVIGDGFWHSHFGGSSAAIGASLTLSGHPFQVVGIVPADFFGVQVGEGFDVAAPICSEAIVRGRESLLDERAGWWLGVMGRLRPGMTPEQASSRLRVLGPDWLRDTLPPDYNAANAQSYLGRRFGLTPAGRGNLQYVANLILPFEILLAIAGVVLLVACANLAGLMLARASARRPELAIRLSLGASRARLIRQLLTESLLLTSAGTALGAGFAVWLCAAIERFLNGDRNVLRLALALDGRVLGFTIGLALVTGILVGIIPALRTTRISLAAGARSNAGAAERTGVGRWIVSVQVALSLVLLIGAGLFLRSFLNLAHVNPGFDPAHVLLVRMQPPTTPLPNAAARAQRAVILAGLQALPGVQSASESFTVPTSGLQWDGPMQAAGEGSAASIPDAMLDAVSPGYFATLRTPMFRGRDFASGDSASSPPVVILNESAARQLYPHGDALGKFVTEGEPPNLGPPAQVVGIVADEKWNSLRTASPAAAFYPWAQSPLQFATANYEVRSELPVRDLEREVRGAFLRVAPEVGFELQPYSQLVLDGIQIERLLGALSALFGGLALLLTAIGLYGVISYAANRRRKEFGIRLALGARPASLSRLVMRSALGLLAAGSLVGALAAWAVTRFLQHALGRILFGLAPGDVLTLVGAMVTLAIVALFASFLPARRAARLDPMLTLREE